MMTISTLNSISKFAPKSSLMTTCTCKHCLHILHTTLANRTNIHQLSCMLFSHMYLFCHQALLFTDGQCCLKGHT